MKYVHTNIISKDWKKLAKFYRKVFKCKIVPPVRNQCGEWLAKGTGLKKAHLRGAHLLLPGYGKNGPTLEIYSYSKMSSKKANMPNRIGYGHIAFEVDDVKKSLKKMIKHGGSAFGKISKRKVDNIGTITFVYAQDPDGNMIELQNWNRV